MLQYARATGVLYQDGKVMGRGWAGRNIIDPTSGQPVLGLNNAVLSFRHEVGPLPKGRYKITAHDAMKGPYTLHLEPLADDGEKTNPDGSFPHMMGRAGFLIHGWTVANPFDSSEGCICLPSDVRLGIIQSGEEIIEVL